MERDIQKLQLENGTPLNQWKQFKKNETKKL